LRAVWALSAEIVCEYWIKMEGIAYVNSGYRSLAATSTSCDQVGVPHMKDYQDHKSDCIDYGFYDMV